MQSRDTEPPLFMLRQFGRYALSISGLASVAAAHFFLAVILVRDLPRAQYGLFSLLMTVIPFGLSICGAVLSVSLARLVAAKTALAHARIAAHLKSSILFSLLFALVLSAIALAEGTDALTAVIFGLYAGLMCLRFFGRSHAYARARPNSVFVSDLIYSICVIVGIASAAALQIVSLRTTAVVLVTGILLGSGFLGRSFWQELWMAIFAGSLRDYSRTWKETARWSLLGVVATELAVNAHTYIVTALAGPQAFAVLAAGSLFVRPLMVAMNATPDLERPRLSRSIAAGDFAGANRTLAHFRISLLVCWMVVVLFAFVLLLYRPDLLLKHNYAVADVGKVIAIWAAIMFFRLYRVPESVFLQAAGDFRPLARASLIASFVSVLATGAMLGLAGPIWSLCGVLAGEVVFAFSVGPRGFRIKGRHAEPAGAIA